MQSDWHRYNLKRRVASLPPLASETFAEKVLANKATAAATAARASFEKRCDACVKTYYSEGAYYNHLGSQKHKVSEAKLLARNRGLDGMETDSMADSTFTLGDTLDTASTHTAAADDEDEDDEEESDDDVKSAVQGMKAANIREEAASAPRQPSALAPRADAMMTDVNEADDDYEHKSDVKQCLFCNYLSPTLDHNINHMSKQHSFFIPEKDYLVDLPGLVNYLNETVMVLHQCLYCHKGVHTSTGVQTHMRDRGHCMIAYSTEDEQMDVGEFYDFRSTYSDEDTDDDEDEPNGGISLGAKRNVKTTARNEDGEDIEVDEEDEGWESDGSLSSVPTDEITSVPIDQDHNYAKLGLHRHHSHTDPRPHKASDGFHSHAHQAAHAVYHDDFELHLPSGRTAGHRSLRAYYRQNLRNYPTPQERAQQKAIEAGRHVSDDEDDNTSTEGDRSGRGRQIVSRADGGLGMIGVSEDKKRQVRAVEKRARKQEQRAQAQYQWGKDKRNNAQKHFRDPLLQ